MITILLAHLLVSAGEPSLILHLRADSGVVLDASMAVSRWIDQSPRHTDFVGPDSAHRPTSTTSGLQGRPSVRFGGRHVLVDSSSLPLDSGFTMFFVVQDSNPSAWSSVVDKGEKDLNVNLWGSEAGNFQFGQAWVKTVAQTDFQTSKPMLYEATWDGNLARIFVAGRLEDTGSWSGAITRNPTTWLGGVYAQGKWQGFLTGHVGEVRVYSSVLTDSVRISLEDSLLATWKIARLGIWDRGETPRGTTLPTDHRILHLRADSGVVVDDSGRVETWKDLSPRGTDFRPLDGSGAYAPSRRPRLDMVGLQDRPAVRFEGSQILCDTTRLPLDSGFTMLFVARDDKAFRNAYTAFLDKGANDIGVNLWGDNVGNFQIGHSWVKSIVQSNFETGEAELYEATWSGDTGRLYARGKELATTATTLTGLVRARSTWLGGTFHGGSLDYFLTGAVSEVVIYRGVLPDTTRKQAEAALIASWRIGEAMGTHASPGPRPAGFSLARGGARWIVSSDDARQVLLRGLDGSIIARAVFVAGRAELPVPRGAAVLLVEGPRGLESRIVVGAP